MASRRCECGRRDCPVYRDRPGMLRISSRELVLGLAALVFTIVFLIVAFGLVP